MIAKYLIRIIACPFVFALHVIHAIVYVLNCTRLFLMYGGEYITYGKQTRKTIEDVFEKLNSTIK